MLKKLYKMSLVLLMVMVVQVPAFGSSPIQIQIDGISQSIEKGGGEPYITKGTTMVPLAFIGESLGHQVKWEPSTRQVIIDGGNIFLAPNNKTAIIAGKGSNLSTPPIIKAGRTYVPLRFVSTALGYNIDFANNTVSISTTNKSPIVKDKGYALKLIGQGIVDTIPFKIGEPITSATKVLGDGYSGTMQGIRVHNYGDYTINESLYDSHISGFTFSPGFKLYDITIGDNAKEIQAKLGSNYEKFEIGIGDELAPSNAEYYYYYTANNNSLSLYFDRNGNSLAGWFIAR